MNSSDKTLRPVMLLTRRRKFVKRITITTVQICTFIFIGLFVIFPIVYRYSITLQRALLFLTFVNQSKDLDFTNPASIGLYATRNFYLSVLDPDVDERRDGIRIGAWHMLPKHVAKRFSRELNIDVARYEQLQNVTDIKDEHLDRMETVLKSEFPEVNAQNEQQFYERMLKLPGTVILYLHGNTASRGFDHRVEMYHVLRNLGYHVITIDYRGFGDSDPITPSEEGVVRDSLAIYEYITNLTTNPIFVWGHSLGTGIATNVCSILNNFKVKPRGLVLESPFTNIREEVRLHPISLPFRGLPWFEFTILGPMYSNSLRFESDQHISEFRFPVMILHAEDDLIVPFELGYQLYRIALDTRGKSFGPVEFHRFDGDLEYGHHFICRAPDFPGLVRPFIDNYRNEVF